MLSQFVHVQARVHDDPRDQEARGPGQEALLGQLPGAAILSLVHALHRREPDVDEAGGEEREQEDADEALHGDEAPDDAEDEADDLPAPVDHVQELFLL